MEEMEKETRALPRNPEVALAYEIREALPVLRTDRVKLKVILLNLIDNGIKFCSPGGTVTIRAHQNEGHVKLAVADDGIGIPEGRVREIFVPFHQLDSSTIHHEGTGLGLALARLVLKAHGSDLEVQSKADQGSTFQFSLKAS